MAGLSLVLLTASSILTQRHRVPAFIRGDSGRNPGHVVDCFGMVLVLPFVFKEKGASAALPLAGA